MGTLTQPHLSEAILHGLCRDLSHTLYVVISYDPDIIRNLLVDTSRFLKYLALFLVEVANPVWNAFHFSLYLLSYSVICFAPF
jgi:hypothetical protein